MSTRTAGFLRRHWRGEAKLWRAFWIFGTVIQAVTCFGAFGVMTVSGAPEPLIYTVWVLALGYSLWTNVATWRCAFNTAWRPLGYAARVCAVTWFLLFLAIFALLVQLAINVEDFFDWWQHLD